jgi:cytochrome P450
VDEIYASGARKRDKQAHYLGVLAGPTTNAAFGTADHDLHRVRRNAMNKFFSHAQITRLEPEIATLVQLLCEKLLSMTSPVLEKKSYVDVSIFWNRIFLSAIQVKTQSRSRGNDLVSVKGSISVDIIADNVRREPD